MVRRKSKGFMTSMWVAAVLMAVPAWADDDSDSDALAGSWEVVATSDVTGDTVSFLATYEADGTLISSGAGPTPVTSDGHGVWDGDDGEFSTRSVILSFDSGGNLVARAVTMSEIEVSGDSYSGTFQVVVTDPGGNVIATNSGTESGTRITLD